MTLASPAQPQSPAVHPYQRHEAAQMTSPARGARGHRPLIPHYSLRPILNMLSTCHSAFILPLLPLRFTPLLIPTTCTTVLICTTRRLNSRLRLLLRGGLSPPLPPLQPIINPKMHTIINPNPPLGPPDQQPYEQIIQPAPRDVPDVVAHTLVRAHLEDLVQVLEGDVVERALAALARRGQLGFGDEELDQRERERAQAREDADERRLPR